jgi:hypothetical protein
LQTPTRIANAVCSADKFAVPTLEHAQRFEPETNYSNLGMQTVLEVKSWVELLFYALSTLPMIACIGNSVVLASNNNFKHHRLAHNVHLANLDLCTHKLELSASRNAKRFK